MIAVIVASRRYPEMFGLDDHLPLPLFPLVDRPILHHIVEYLIGQGIRRFEFILSHLPDKIESYLGDGTRWGCSFGFHLVPSSEESYHMVRTIASGVREDVLLGSADCLPELDVTDRAGPALFYLPSGDWSGWAVLPSDSLALSAYVDDISKIATGRELPAGIATSVVRRALDFRTGSQLLRSQDELMTGQFSGLMIGGRQSEPGIWISRNVTLHPTVTLQSPVYIGANCRIGRGTKVGPSAVISENCIVDNESSIEDSVIAPGTFIGQGLELNHVLVDRNRLVNIKIGASFLVSDTFLLSSLIERTRHRPIQQLFSSFIALFLFLAFAPAAAIFLLSWKFSRSTRTDYQRAIRIPTGDNSAGWREYSLLRFRAGEQESVSNWSLFFLRVWPGLLSVIKGDLFLVGVQPRSLTEVPQLPNDWRAIFLKSKAGLITEAAVMFGDRASEDEIYTAEAYYSATETVGHDLRLAALYFWGLLTGPSHSNASFARDQRL